MDYRIYPPEEILEATVALPLSKSISARALVMAALGSNQPAEVADCEDTAAIRTALSQTTGRVDIGAAGTAMRFMTAYYAACEGADIVLDGSDRMRHRPIAPLVDSLRRLGADISYEGEEGFPPLHIRGKRLAGGKLTVDSSVSSQFVSAILMVAPTMAAPLKLTLEGESVSMPYIKMTIGMMTARGIDVELIRDTVTAVPGQYKSCGEVVERDWSAAAFWYEIAAITAGWVTLRGLNKHSLQGDSALATIGPRIGVVTEFTDEGAELSATPDIYSRLDLDMTDTPDLVQPLAVAACAIGMPFRFTGVANLRIKETDRLEALRVELLKIGCVVETEGDNVISWESRRLPVTEMPRIDTHDDHRMAMAFAPLAVFVPGIVICDAEVVAKSYPGFWEDLRAAGFTLEEIAESDDNSL